MGEEIQAKALPGAGHRFVPNRVKATCVMQGGPRWSRSHSRRRFPVACAPCTPPSARPCGCRGICVLVRRCALFRIELTPDESTELNRRATKYTLPYFEVIRAKMILMAATGMDNDQIAERLATGRDVFGAFEPPLFKGWSGTTLL